MGLFSFLLGAAKENILNKMDMDIPIVIADRDISSLTSDVVLIDNHEGGYEATKYLINLNHKRIACITGPSLMTPSALRVEGYKACIKRMQGIPIDESLICQGDFRYEEWRNHACENLLNNPKPPTAVFVCNDMMALGAIRAIHECRKKNSRRYFTDWI